MIFDPDPALRAIIAEMYYANDTARRISERVKALTGQAVNPGQISAYARRSGLRRGRPAPTVEALALRRLNARPETPQEKVRAVVPGSFPSRGHSMIGGRVR